MLVSLRAVVLMCLPGVLCVAAMEVRAQAVGQISVDLLDEAAAETAAEPPPASALVDPLSLFPPEPEELLDARKTAQITGGELRSLLVHIFSSATATVLVDPAVEGRVDAAYHNISYRELLPALFSLYRLELRPLTPQVYAVVPAGTGATQQAAIPARESWAETAAAEAAAQQEATQAEFQIRLMAEPQDRDHIEVDYVALETSTGQVHLPLHRRVICTGEDVVSATLQEDERGLFVLIALTDDGGERLRRATGGNLGKQLGLLYRGQLVAAPTIRDEVSRSVMVTGSGPDWPETARAMVEALGAGAP